MGDGIKVRESGQEHEGEGEGIRARAYGRGHDDESMKTRSYVQNLLKTYSNEHLSKNAQVPVIERTIFILIHV